MGRQARQKAEQRELRRRQKADPEAAGLAAAADAAFSQALPQGWRVDWAGFERLRTGAKAKLDIDWPNWCYLPWMTVAWQPFGDEGVHVWSAGYRLGAALRRAREETAAEPGPPTGRVVAPHMRSSHWRLYWTGPRSEAQTPVLKLLAPTAVNFRLEDGEGSPLTVVRPARPAPTSTCTLTPPPPTWRRSPRGSLALRSVGLSSAARGGRGTPLRINACLSEGTMSWRPSATPGPPSATSTLTALYPFAMVTVRRRTEPGGVASGCRTRAESTEMAIGGLATRAILGVRSEAVLGGPHNGRPPAVRTGPFTLPDNCSMLSRRAP